MAITVTLDFPRAQRLGRGVAKMISGSFALSNAYPTGGEAANGANGITRHFKSCKEVTCEQNSGYLFEFASNKIKVYAPVDVIAGNTEIGNDVYILKSNTTGKLEVSTNGTAFQSVGAEVSNGSNLAAVNAVRFVAYGY